MKNLYGDYVVLYKMTDADEILEKITRAIPALARQIQMTNQSLGYQLDLDTLQFIVHTKGEHGVTVGWKCYEEEVKSIDGQREGAAGGGILPGGTAPGR